MTSEHDDALAAAKAALAEYELEADHHSEIYVDGVFNPQMQYWEGVGEGIANAREYITALEAENERLQTALAAAEGERDAAVAALDEVITDMREVDWNFVPSSVCKSVANVLGDTNKKTKRYRELLVALADEDAQQSPAANG